MAYNRAKMFNRKAGRRKSKPDRIIASLNLSIDMVIVDIGAGGGFFSFLFANQVGETGKVYAVDSNPENLEYIVQQARHKKISNIIAVSVQEDETPSIPENADMVFLRNIYHHLKTRVAYFNAMKSMVKPTGKVAIIEYADKGSRFSFHRRFGHFVAPEIIHQEMADAGYAIVEQFTFLAEQSFTLFSPDENG